MDNQRLFDLVRHQRGELLDADLITQEEYAMLVTTDSKASVRRLETYDEMRTRIKQMEKDQNAISHTYGDLVRGCDWLARRILPEEWDNKTPSEQRDWLLKMFKEWQRA